MGSGFCALCIVASEHDRLRVLAGAHLKNEIVELNREPKYSKYYRDIRQDHDQLRSLGKDAGSGEAQDVGVKPDFDEHFRNLELERQRVREKLEDEKRQYQIDEYILASKAESVRRLYAQKDYHGH